MTGSMREGQWVIGLFRAFRLERGGEVVARFEGRKEELLLAYLALAPQSAHRRASIAEELWPGKDASSARRGLSYSLCILREQLRKLGLPDGIYVGAQTLQLNPKVGTDIQRFGELVLAAAHSEAPAEQIRFLEEAVALYGDGLLPSYTQPWIDATREQLEAVHQAALRQLSELLPSGDLHATLKNLPTSAWEGYRRTAAGVGGSGRPSPASPASANGPPAPAADPKQLLALAQEAESKLAGSERKAWLERIDARYPEIRAVLDTAARQDGSRHALPLATAMGPYWQARNMAGEGLRYLEQLLPGRLPSPTLRLARALHATGALALADGDLAHAGQRLNEALAMWRRLDDAAGLARTLAKLGELAYTTGELDRAHALYDEGLPIMRRLGTEPALMDCLLGAALVAIDLESAAGARGLLEERLALAERLGDPRATASSLSQLGITDVMAGDPAAAEQRAGQAVRLASAQGDLGGEALALLVAGRAAHAAGEHQVALRHFMQSQRAAHEAGDMVAVGESLRYQAATYLAFGKPGRAAALTRQSIDLLQANSNPRGVALGQALLAEIPATRGRRKAVVAVPAL